MHDDNLTRGQARTMRPVLARGSLRVFPVAIGWVVWWILSRYGSLIPFAADTTFTLLIGGLLFVVMLSCVVSVVHFADALAERLREPYGTLVLTLSATLIEVSLMLRVMLAGLENPTLLRDTVFAVLMISLNALVGLSLIAGAWRHREQSYNLRGALSFLQLIVPISLMVLILPNHTQSSPGPTLAPYQEAYLGLLCVVVYGLFLLLQTGRHRSYFDHGALSTGTDAPASSGQAPRAVDRGRLAGLAAGLLISLLPVVLLSHYLGIAINYGIDELQAPTALGGLIIACLGLSSEGLGAFRAARLRRMQRAVNLCLGSSLSSIGMTTPTVLIAAGVMNLQLTLGLDGLNSTLLLATLLNAMLTFTSGYAHMLQGIVHLMLFIGYIMFILLP
jgi:Ca2+:H+ antiporter